MKSTEKLYDEFPYERTFTAKVLSSALNENQSITCVLDRTLFFPEEGGQTCDKGTLAADGTTYTVQDVQIREGVIYHTLVPLGADPEGQNAGESSEGAEDCIAAADSDSSEENRPAAAPLSAGTAVTGTIDWDHRYSNMQNHTGEHIFSGLVHKRFGYDNVGFHLSDHEVTMDYSGPLSAEDVQAIEEETNRAILAGIPVECRYPAPAELSQMAYRQKKPIAGPVRIVTIPGIDACACCAPHVRSTAEVGILKVQSFMNYKGGTRLSILCGFRAFCDYRAKQNVLTEISRFLKVPQLQTFEAVNHLSETLTETRHALLAAEEKLLRGEMDRLDQKAADVSLFSGSTDVNMIRRAVNTLKGKHSGISMIFFAPCDGASVEAGDAAGKWSFIAGAGSADRDASAVLSHLKKHFPAAGGGKPAMVQGSVQGSKNAIAAALQDFSSL